MNWIVPLSDMSFGQQEIKAVENVLTSGWLTMGDVTQKFENEFKEYTGTKFAFAVTNATAALHMACEALRLGPGDEVIVPSLTFVATANAIRYTGATPIFVDIVSKDDLTISPEAAERAITSRTKAIMVMHYAGYACDMPSIMSLAKKHNIAVIEDAAHAIGSRLNGKMLGTLGSVGCYSFFSNKNMTTGEGGMLVTDDENLAEKFRLLRSHGMTSLTLDRYQGHAWSYNVVALGYNYRIDEMRSALGRVQLSKLEQFNSRRKEVTTLYRKLFAELTPSIIVPFESHPGESACHIMPIVLQEGVDRIRFMEQMKTRGIQTSIHYPPIHSFKAYSDIYHHALPITEDIAKREVTLPLYPTMTEEQVMIVARSVQDAVRIQV